MDVMEDTLVLCNRSSDKTKIVGYLANFFNKARPQVLVSAAITTTKEIFYNARFEKKLPLLKPYIARANASASRGRKLDDQT